MRVPDGHPSNDHELDEKMGHRRDGNGMPGHHHDVRDLQARHHGDVMVDGNQNHRDEHEVRGLDDHLRNDHGRHEFRMAFRHPYVVAFRKDSKRQFRAWQHEVLRPGSLTLVRLRTKRCAEHVTLVLLRHEREPWSLLHLCLLALRAF